VPRDDRFEPLLHLLAQGACAYRRESLLLLTYQAGNYLAIIDKPKINLKVARRVQLIEQGVEIAWPKVFAR
jgi:hypothetical protein